MIQANPKRCIAEACADTPVIKRLIMYDCRKWLGRGGYFTLNYLYIRHLQQLQIKTMILNVKDQKVCRIFAIFNQFPITEF